MRRAFAVLKYLPAVLCALLVVTCVVSHWWTLGAVTRWQRGATYVGLSRGRLVCEHFVIDDQPAKLIIRRHGARPKWLRDFKWYRDSGYLALNFPISIIVTLMLPLAIGLCSRFRFPLWSWLAFTALVAVECAYYLRS